MLRIHCQIQSQVGKEIAYYSKRQGVQNFLRQVVYKRQGLTFSPIYCIARNDAKFIHIVQRAAIDVLGSLMKTNWSSAYKVTHVSILPMVISLINRWAQIRMASGSNAILNKKVKSGSHWRTPVCHVKGLDLFQFITIEDLGLEYKIWTHSIELLMKTNFLSAAKRYGHSTVSKALWASRWSVICILRS